MMVMMVGCDRGRRVRGGGRVAGRKMSELACVEGVEKGLGGRPGHALTGCVKSEVGEVISDHFIETEDVVKKRTEQGGGHELGCEEVDLVCSDVVRGMQLSGEV